SRDPAYAQAFRDYGLDVRTLDPAEAGKRLRGKSVRVQLAAALDDWAVVRKGTGAGSNELLGIARAADPDPWRNRLRDALQANTPPTQNTLAVSPPIRELPPSRWLLFADALGNRGAVSQAVMLLRQTQLLYSSDFWVNQRLAHWLTQEGSARLDDALRFATA